MKVVALIYKKQRYLSLIVANIICVFLFFKLWVETQMIKEQQQNINTIKATSIIQSNIMKKKLGNGLGRLPQSDAKSASSAREVKVEKRQQLLRMKAKIQLNSKFQRNPPYTLGAFIHVGKTGGSTISQLLRNGCHSYIPKPCRNETELPVSRENAVSKLTTYYHIPDFSEGNLAKYHNARPYDFFVVTLRDPLSRAVSAYAAGHPFRIALEKYNKWKIERPELYDHLETKYRNDRYRMLQRILTMDHSVSSDEMERKLMYICFETLEEYAQLLSNFNDYNTDETEIYNDDAMDCASIAKITLHHIFEKSMEHNFWDLRQIFYQIHHNLSNKDILAVRQEFLWQDWASVNRWLGQEGEIFNTTMTERNSTTMDVPIKIDLSKEGRRNLCLALRNEYHLYLKLLTVSKNLSEVEVLESLSISQKNCPWLKLALPTKGERETFTVSKSQTWKF